MDNLTILTSVIGASAATIGVVVTKDSKISEFRQAWVDALRADISRFLALSLHINSAARSDEKKSFAAAGTEFYAGMVLESNELNAKIRLRLDESKPLQKALAVACSDTSAMAADAPKAKMTHRIDMTRLAATAVLDEAWSRVKKGERRFRWTFHFALGTLLLNLVVLVVHWWKTGHHF
ncbi:MAG: hypothetical protein V4555_00740 [Acidobacteriota bacterium]